MSSCFFFLLVTVLVVVSSGQFYDQIEGNFVTLGGSTCSYTEVKDETKSTALIIECYCKKADQQSLKYICLYAGNLEKECPPFEENKDTFYKEIAKFFEEHEEQACVLEEINVGNNTSVCKGTETVLTRRFMDGDDPLHCGKEGKSHKEL